MLNGEIEELKSRIGAALDNVARTLKSKMDTSAQLIAKYEGELRGLPQAERELAALTRKTMVTGELYSFLLKKHEEMRIAQAGIVGNLRIVEQPVTPLLPVAPKKTRITALGLLTGLILGIGLTFLAESMDDTVKGAAKLERQFGLPVFGEIPSVIKSRPGETPLLLSGSEPLNLEESFNTLATNLRFIGARSGLKRILFASSDTGEGKTTCMVNLGYTLATRGARVLLIDCDLRRPSLHRILGVREQPGLSQVLVSGNSWREAVIRARKAKIDVLPAGPIPPNQAELLDGDAFAQLLSSAAEAYDYVLLDVPPVLAFSDAAIVSTRVDGVFVIAAAGRTRSPALERTLALLRNVQAPIRGAIVNFCVQQTDKAAEYYQTKEAFSLAGMARTKLRVLRERFVRT
jgi:tyrosine-protein kinase Etk/Wzc